MQMLLDTSCVVDGIFKSSSEVVAAVLQHTKHNHVYFGTFSILLTYAKNAYEKVGENI